MIERYRVELKGHRSHLVQDDQGVTFTQAKENLREYLRAQGRAYRKALQATSRMTIRDVKS